MVLSNIEINEITRWVLETRNSFFICGLSNLIILNMQEDFFCKFNFTKGKLSNDKQYLCFFSKVQLWQIMIKFFMILKKSYVVY